MRTKDRDLARWSWPVPWWVVAIPGLLVVAGAGVTMTEPAGWAYISPAAVSGLPHQALVPVGPLAAVSACWVAERFLDRRSPLAAPTLPRASGAQGTRVMGVLALWWAGLFLLTTAAGGLWWAVQATGGTASPVRFVMALAQLEFFVLSGLLIGVVVARWYASLLALAWSMLWVLVIPVEYAVAFPDRRSGLETFMFPALAGEGGAGELHPALVAGLVLWWVVVLGGLMLLIRGWLAQVAGYGSRLLITGGVVIAAGAAAGLLLPAWAPDREHQALSEPIVCMDGEVLQVCVTQEQQPALGELAEEVDRALTRIGDHLPADYHTVASPAAQPRVYASGVARERVLTANLSLHGTDDVTFDIGTSLVGLENCAGEDRATTWAFEFASWYAPHSEYGWPAEQSSLAAFTEEEVWDWYTQNQQDLRACDYQGDGP